MIGHSSIINWLIMDLIKEITKPAEFDSFIKENPTELIVVHFWAPWAPQCQQMSDVMLELAKDPQCKEVKFVKVEAEALPDVSQRYEITAVPTCVLIRGGAAIDRVNGANAGELSKKVQHHASIQPVLNTPKPPVEKQDLETRLKELVSRAPVMLFMKGSPTEPRCGFSKQTIQILNDHNIKYKTFDILSDEEVRQGLKKYSNWPTYPQLYGDGELIGGLDIIKELVESGELVSSLPEQESIEDRLKKIISKEKVMLFMKGSPDTPKCGFSKTTIGILREIGVEFGHFDILTDEEVRQGLKKYSNWPTYPQIYVNNELVGGLDIIKELKDSGDLESTLKGE